LQAKTTLAQEEPKIEEVSEQPDKDKEIHAPEVDQTTLRRRVLSKAYHKARALALKLTMQTVS
jgi:hypothetical protein